MQPLLIADSGGTKTDWCFVDENKVNHFFTTESYHPTHWSSDFELRISTFWNDFPAYKIAELHFFGSGCLKTEKSDELKLIFNRIGFKNVTVKSDLHAAALALYGTKNGYCAILGTGSVFFEWYNQEVKSISGGKGHEIGDEGSGFYFGKLVYQAYKEKKLSAEQKHTFEKKVNVKAIEEMIEQKRSKTALSQIPNMLGDYLNQFAEWHQLNVDLFFNDVWKSQSPLDVKIVGGYFVSHSEILIPHLSEKQIHIQKFTDRPIDSLVDYFVGSDE